jgi:biopolymer transport protein ExbB/TolQ
MEDSKTQDLLIQLMQDIAVIKAKLDVIEEIKIDAKTLNTRVDHLEAQNREHDKTLRSLEHRANEMEQFTRNNMNDAKKQQTSVFISMGLAVFSAVVSVIINFIF